MCLLQEYVILYEQQDERGGALIDRAIILSQCLPTLSRSVSINLLKKQILRLITDKTDCTHQHEMVDLVLCERLRSVIEHRLTFKLSETSSLRLPLFELLLTISG